MAAGQVTYSLSNWTPVSSETQSVRDLLLTWTDSGGGQHRLVLANVVNEWGTISDPELATLYSNYVTFGESRGLQPATLGTAGNDCLFATNTLAAVLYGFGGDDVLTGDIREKVTLYSYAPDGSPISWQEERCRAGVLRHDVRRQRQ